MVQEIEVIEVDIDGPTFWVRPVGSWGPFLRREKFHDLVCD